MLDKWRKQEDTADSTLTIPAIEFIAGESSRSIRHDRVILGESDLKLGTSGKPGKTFLGKNTIDSACTYGRTESFADLVNFPDRKSLLSTFDDPLSYFGEESGSLRFCKIISARS